jgi:hypothetical protein
MCVRSTRPMIRSLNGRSREDLHAGDQDEREHLLELEALEFRLWNIKAELVARIRAKEGSPQVYRR